MSEIIRLISYENNERLGSDCLYDQNDHWNSNLSKNRLTCVFIGSFSINDIAIFGCVIDKQYDSLSDLIISYSTAINLITLHRRKYWNKLYIDVSIGTQNILIIFICTSIFTKYGSLYTKYVHDMRRSMPLQAIRGQHGGDTAFYPSTWIYRGSDLWTPRTAL